MPQELDDGKHIIHVGTCRGFFMEYFRKSLLAKKLHVSVKFADRKDVSLVRSAAVWTVQ